MSKPTLTEDTTDPFDPEQCNMAKAEILSGWRKTCIKHLKAQERIAELESENAKLKEEVRELNSYIKWSKNNF